MGEVLCQRYREGGEYFVLFSRLSFQKNISHNDTVEKNRVENDGEIM
jgi:hypothetical protein